MITSFLVNKIVRIQIMELRNGCFTDSNHFESELPFLEENIENLQKPSE
jgi:hypothetical protein